MSRKKWPELPWYIVVKRIRKSVFQVRAGKSAGTGFIISSGHSKKPGQERAFLVATAWHVIKDAVTEGEEITLVDADNTISLHKENCEMEYFRIGEEALDSAIIAVRTRKNVFSGELLPMLPTGSMLAQGADLGWLGFPALANSELCFFHGFISGHVVTPPAPPAYLVDGVAINGVSGGPAFDNQAHLVGSVSAYIPNQVTATVTLPGLMTLVPINFIRIWIETHLPYRMV